MKRILTIIWVAAAMQGVHVANLHAQDNDFGLDFSVGAEKKIRRGMDFGLEAEARTQDNTRKIDRWSLGASFGVKLLNTTTFDLKAGLKWEYLWVNNLAECNDKYEEETYYTADGYVTQNEYVGYNHKHTYWRNRHRTSFSLNGVYKPNKRWEFALREMVQYSHFCEASTTTDKYRLDDDDNLALKSSERKDYSGKDKVALRSRLTAQYDIRHCLFDPYAQVEYGCGLNYYTSKWRFTVGTDYKLNKQNKLTLFYRYQTENDDDEPNGHIIGLGYGFKF